MAQDKRNRQPGLHASSRQPQGDFGRGSDHAPLGSSDDVNRELNKRGAYRDAETSEQEDAPPEVPYRRATDKPDPPKKNDG